MTEIAMSEVRRRLAAGTRILVTSYRSDRVNIPVQALGDMVVHEFRGSGFGWRQLGGTRRGEVSWSHDATFRRYGDEIVVDTPARTGRRPDRGGHLMTIRVVAPPQQLPRVLYLVPRLERLGHHRHDSEYVETCWLPRLGPASWAVLRYIGDRLDDERSGNRVDLVEMAGAIGVSPKLDHRGMVWRALERLQTFGLLDRHREDTAMVPRLVPPLPLAEIDRLPAGLQGYARRHASQTVAHDATV